MDEIYQRYIEWHSVPQIRRKPRTTASFMEENSITEEDIEAFKKRPTFQADLAVATFKWAKEQVPAMLHRLHENASNSPKADAVKLYLDVIKKTDEEQEKQKLEDIISITIFTDEQRKQIIDRLRGRGGFDMPRGEEEPTHV